MKKWLLSIGEPDSPWEFSHFSTFERPKSSWKLLSAALEYRKFVVEDNFSGHLFGKTYDAMFVKLQHNFPTLALYDKRTKSALLQNGENLLDAFASAGVTYAFVCLQEECDFRNFHCTDARGSGGMRGVDLRKYIPGLYWLNYFSNAVIDERGLDIERIAQLANGEIRAVEHGIVLRLYERPEDWFDKKDIISNALLSVPGFFSMARVQRPSKSHLTPKEILEYALESSRLWP